MASTSSADLAAAMRAAPPLAGAKTKAARRRRLQAWFQGLPWAELFAFLSQAAEDGMSKDEAIAAASIVIDGAVNWEQRVDGPLGVWLERKDRKLAEQGLHLAWGIIERQAAKKAESVTP